MLNLINSNNLLKQWHSEALVLSSPLNIEPQYERSKVDFIYQTLLTTFGMGFFRVKAGTDKPIDKISWLWGLLSTNKSIPCYHALYDVCLLIEYSNTLDQSLQKEFHQLKKNPETLRSFFFELFIYRFLDLNKIENEKKVVSGNQVLEGTCEIDSKVFLFECRKAFLPSIHELDIKRRILMDIWLLGQQYQRGVGMICTIKLSRPILGIHHSDTKGKLRSFFRKLCEIKYITKISYTHTSEYATLYVKDYDEATLIETEAGKDYDILYYVVPPKIPVPGVADQYRARIACNFSLSHSQIYRKLEVLLKEKKKQHRNSSFQHKIIFLDSESLPEFHMNIFHDDSMFDMRLIKKTYDKVGMKDILCIVRRQYNNGGPFMSVDIIAPDHLHIAADKLKSMLLLYYDDLTRTNFHQSEITVT